MIRIQATNEDDIVTVTTYTGNGGVSDTFLQPGVSDLRGSFRLYKKDMLRSIITKV